MHAEAGTNGCGHGEERISMQSMKQMRLNFYNVVFLYDGSASCWNENLRLSRRFSFFSIAARWFSQKMVYRLCAKKFRRVRHSARRFLLVDVHNIAQSPWEINTFKQVSVKTSENHCAVSVLRQRHNAFFAWFRSSAQSTRSQGAGVILWGYCRHEGSYGFAIAAFLRSQFLVSCGICDSKNAVFSGVCPNGFAECLTPRTPKRPPARVVSCSGGIFLRRV